MKSKTGTLLADKLEQQIENDPNVNSTVMVVRVTNAPNFVRVMSVHPGKLDIARTKAEALLTRTSIFTLHKNEFTVEYN